MRGLHSITVLATLAAFCAGGCSAASEAFPAGAESSNGGASSGTASPGVGAAVGGGTASSSGSVAALPPETKVESSYQTPVSTRSVVWIANPTSGRVAYINAQTFSVQTVAAGDGPTYLAAVSDPTDDVAIVQNVLSQNITLLRVHPGSLAPPTTTVFPSTADANSWAVSQSGRWAIAWANATQITNPDPTQGFQEIAVIDTTQVRPSTILAVGYRPASIAFSGDSHAYAVTQDGITGIDLLGGTQPSVTQNFPLVAPGESGVDAATGDASGTADAPIPGAIDAAAIDATADAGPSGTVSAVGSPSSGAGGTSVPDVSFTSDGLYALARTDGVLAINIVSLQDGKSTAVVMPALPTDLTVSPDGTFAVAVLRDRSEIVDVAVSRCGTPRNQGGPVCPRTVLIAQRLEFIVLAFGQGIVRDDERRVTQIVHHQRIFGADAWGDKGGLACSRYGYAGLPGLAAGRKELVVQTHSETSGVYQ